MTKNENITYTMDEVALELEAGAMEQYLTERDLAAFHNVPFKPQSELAKDIGLSVLTHNMFDIDSGEAFISALDALIKRESRLRDLRTQAILANCVERLMDPSYPAAYKETTVRSLKGDRFRPSASIHEPLRKAIFEYWKATGSSEAEETMRHLRIHVLTVA